jgi:uncharacterized protein
MLEASHQHRALLTGADRDRIASGASRIVSTVLPMPIQRSFALIVTLALTLAAMVPLVAPASTRAAATELFISEYIEGSSNNKALEIYNGTGAAIDLAAGGYSVQMFFNGSATAGLTIPLTGTLASGDVHVVAHSSAGAAIQAQADQLNGAGWFNGDDAVALTKGGATIDAIGQVGFDPGSQWGSDDASTADNTLRRKGSIEAGDTNGTDAFDPSAEWDGFATDTFDGLGAHGDQVAPEPDGVVISQVYGGGGNAGATFTNDFIELFNTTQESIDLTGWSVQYASSTGSSWQTTVLSGSIAPGGYYLVQEGAGAGGTTPLPSPDATGGIAMGGANGKVALVDDDTALSDSCPLDLTVDFVGYGSANCFEGAAAAPGLTNSTAAIRDDGGATDTDDNADDFAAGAPNPRNSGNTTPTDPCVGDATLISAVQGTGFRSPLEGQRVTVQGVVVGDFQNNDQPDDGHLNGFFVQEEDADVDDDEATSEALFVFGGPDVSVGDEVSVGGTVVEFGSAGSLLTELTGVDVAVCDTEAALPAATQLSLPVEDPDVFERYEGMLVTFPQSLTISEFFNFDRFGEIVLTVDRDHQPTAVHEPGSEEAEALAEENRLNRILLDDGISTQNPSFTRHPNGEEFTLDNRFRGGDTVANVTGVMDDSFGLYRVQPTEGADYTAVNLRPAAPGDVGGTLRVASFNVLNYFTTLTSAGNVCGPLENQGCRGADTAEELERQQAKIVAALATMDADVVGLIEIENHAGDVPTATLVEALNAQVGAGTYDYVATGGIGTDVIRVAFIYKPATVTPVGEFAILDSTIDPRFDDEHNRPVLAQAFEENATGGVVTVAVNHLKSKGSGCGGPPDDDPVQGNCNLTREAAAEALVDWLAADPTGSGDLDALIIGDLNSYDKEDPIDAIREAGYTDLVHQSEGELAYSYLFDGQLGYLDHALSSPTLSSQVAGATIWHINADEPDILDYDMSFKSDAQDTLYATDAYRSSDHDPVIVGLDLLAYAFEGLEPPIDEENTARAGSTVAVRFSLGTDVDVDDVLFESMQVYGCGEWPSGASEDATGTGSTGFRYDPADDQYLFNWKTDRAWAGECKALVLTLQDGTYAIAEFEFR